MISFVIPTLNEINNIDTTVDKIRQCFKKHEEYEIIFVDDNSDDGSLEKIIMLSNNNINIDYCLPTKRLGLGNALILGQKKTKGDYIFFLDCDHSIDISNLLKLIKSIKKNTLIIGSRYLKDSKIYGVNKFRIFLSKSLNYFVSVYLKIPVFDISHSCRVFPKSIFMETENLKHPIFFWEHTLYCLKNNMKITEVPIDFYERKSGLSKNSFLSLFKIIFYAMLSILKLKIKYKRYPKLVSN